MARSMVRIGAAGGVGVALLSCLCLPKAGRKLLGAAAVGGGGVKGLGAASLKAAGGAGQSLLCLGASLSLSACL